MKSSLKDSHIFGIIGVCAITLLVLLGQGTPEEETFTIVAPQYSQLAQASPTATLALSPSLHSVQVGGTFTVNIILNTGGQAIYGVDINRLRFNSAVLEVQDADATREGIQITKGTLLSGDPVNLADNTAGTVQFSQIVTAPGTYSGAGTLASVTFRAKAAGTANVTMDFSAGSGTDTNVAGANGDILSSVGSGTYTVTSADSSAPTAPGTPTLTIVSGTQINLTWTASTDNVGVTGYRVERCSGSATCTGFAQIGTPTAASYPDSGLTANQTYRYRVAAVDAAGNVSTFSNISTAVTDVTPPTILNITIPAKTTTSATISWSTGEPADTQVEYGLTASYGSQSTLAPALTAGHSVILSGLSPATSYNYRVKSRDANGNLATGPNNVFQTEAEADTTAPTVPTSVTATPTSDTKIQLSWIDSTDPAGAGQSSSGIKHYLVYRGSGSTPLTTTVQSSYLDQGLSPDTAYSYQISAVDNANNVSAKSAAVIATTPAVSLAVQRRITLDLEGAPATKRNVVGVVKFLSTTNAEVHEANISTDGLGKYVIDVPAGLPSPVTMKTFIPGYLSRIAQNVNLRDTNLLDVSFPKLLAGNLVYANDQQINSLDFSYLNGKWGTADALADLNKDGEVNSLDFTFLSINWLKNGD